MGVTKGELNTGLDECVGVAKGDPKGVPDPARGGGPINEAGGNQRRTTSPGCSGIVSEKTVLGLTKNSSKVPLQRIT